MVIDEITRVLLMVSIESLDLYKKTLTNLSEKYLDFNNRDPEENKDFRVYYKKNEQTGRFN